VSLRPPRLLLALVIAGATSAGSSQSLPPPSGDAVTDNAGAFGEVYLKITREEVRRWVPAMHHPVRIWTEKRSPAPDFGAWCDEAFDAWRRERPALDSGVAFFLSVEDRQTHLAVGPALEGLIPPGDRLQFETPNLIEAIRRTTDRPEDVDNPVVWNIYAMSYLKKYFGPVPPEPVPAVVAEYDARRNERFWTTAARAWEEDPPMIGLLIFIVVTLVVLLVTHPFLTIGMLLANFGGEVLGASGSVFLRGAGQLITAGGKFGGGGASGEW
jgi:uncharacterized membrane protein YgcG